MQSPLEFDFVIVGAGSAGCVLANRLSADPANKVCLVEAGPEDRNPIIHIPLGITGLMEHKTLNWRSSTAPQPSAGGRSVYLPRGRVLGGSSSINGMIYIRGAAHDYDNWAAQGNAGWAYRDVLPYFLRSENNETWRDSPLHGTGGPLNVAELRARNPAAESFVEAAHQFQIAECPDFNAPTPEGVGYRQVTQKGGQRNSTAVAFLKPARRRPNLTVLPNALTERVLFDGRRATGVRITRDGETRDLLARREVILSAGALGSPQLLQLSGIGDADQLTAMGVPVVHALPGVGRNLHDHTNIALAHTTRSTIPYGLSPAALPKLAWSALEYLLFRRGMFSSNACEAVAFVRSSPDLPRPDLQLSFVSGRRGGTIRSQAGGHGYGMMVILFRPFSRGEVRLASSRPGAPPAIDLGYLSDPRDLELLLKGLKQSRSMLTSAPFAPYGGVEAMPGPAVQDDDALRDYIRNNCTSSFHYVGTCAMGRTPEAVVDASLAVRGVGGLRVVDASVMASIVAGNTNAPVIMIAEKAADLILGREPPAPIDVPAT